MGSPHFYDYYEIRPGTTRILLESMKSAISASESAKSLFHAPAEIDWKLSSTSTSIPLELVYTERKPPTFTVTTEGIELLA